VRPSKRIFDNSKVSDHFAIIPTTQAPSGLSEAEQKLYDLVVRRFMAVFFPSAEYTVTTRISGGTVRPAASRPKARCWSSRAGWPSTARKRPTKWKAARTATRARTWCP
jgi:DNA topoisomerase IA